MPHRVKHPSKKRRKAIYGVDRTLGHFATVYDGERVVAEYDRIHPPHDGIPGLLRFLAEHGFFSAAEAGLALSWVCHSLAEEAEEGGIRAAAEVAERLYSEG